MGARVAEHRVSTAPFGGTTRFRVDLHGVSVFRPGGERTLVRWEWVRDIRSEDGVTVVSRDAQVSFPPGAFGLAAEDLADRLRAAYAIERRADVIEQLAESEGRAGG